MHSPGLEPGAEPVTPKVGRLHVTLTPRMRTSEVAGISPSGNYEARHSDEDHVSRYEVGEPR